MERIRHGAVLVEDERRKRRRKGEKGIEIKREQKNQLASMQCRVGRIRCV